MSEANINEARAALEKDRENRMALCRDAIVDALKTYNCTIRPRVVITPDGTDFSFDIVPQ